MKIFFSMMLFLSLVCFAQAEIYEINSVIDGKTLELVSGEEVQLIGINTSDVGYEALQHLRGWVEEKEVRLEFDVSKRDDQGRLLAYGFRQVEIEIDLNMVGNDLNRVVFPVDDRGKYEVFLNAVMISNGYAKPMSSAPNSKYAELFNELYGEAKKEKRGFWKDGHLRNIAECAKGGGMLKNIKECDRSDSDWCYISEKEQCYAHQVRNGKCAVGEYSEEHDAIVGITPRVLCEERNDQ